MAASFSFSILTPAGHIFEGETESIMAPSIDGYVGVLNNHAAMIAALGHGYCMVRQGSEQRWFAVCGGILEVIHGGGAIILGDYAEAATDQADAIAKAQVYADAVAEDVDENEVSVAV